MACALQQVIGSNLRRLRKSRGLTQEELAGQLGMDRCHLQDIEAGIAEVGSNRLLGFCAALGVSPEVLTEGRPLRVADWKRMMAEEVAV